MFNLLKYGNNPCLEGEGQTYSYQEVQVAVDAMQAPLAGRHLVLVLCENSVPALLGYVALMQQRQVPLLVEAGQKAAHLQGLIAAYRPAYVWLPEQRLADLPAGDIAHRIGHYVLLRLDAGAAPPLHPQLQLLLSTSGSTGSSKLVRLTRANLEANAASITAYLGVRADDVAVTTLPFSYSFGLSIIHTHLLAGASIQVTALTPLSREFWDLVRARRVTSLSGVPYTYDMLRRIKFERFELGAIRYLSQAGGKLSAEGLAYLQRVAAEKGWPCFVMYGQTEAAARMAYLPPDCLAQRSGSIGRAIPNGRFALVDEARQPIAAPQVQGELVYYGPNVALGYASGAADLARGDDWQGELYTGDLAYRDADGFYYIAGRLKRFIKVFGNRVSLDETEAMLLAAFPDCVFICHGQDDCLRIGCVGGAGRDAVLAFISKQLSIHRSAIRCTILAEIPRLSNGKVDYHALNQAQD